MNYINYSTLKILKLKKITPDLFHYRDLISIAHWILGKGENWNKTKKNKTKKKNNFMYWLFTIKEVELLLNILLIKYNISSTIHYDNNRPRIYIWNKVFYIIISYINSFVRSFLYKNLIYRV